VFCVKFFFKPLVFLTAAMIGNGLSVFAAGDTNSPRPVSFVNDVVPALTRAGCNAGTCHGAAAGKNGFKLSLRGYAPELDFLSITRFASGRRVSKTDPGLSLVLRKPLLELPHMGGQALKRGTAEYEVVSAWLAQGAAPPNAKDPAVIKLVVDPPERSARPNMDLSLHVTAVFADGTKRDITHWSRYATNDENIATAAPDGEVHTAGFGETTIMVGYQDKVATARISVPFPYKADAAAYKRLPRANFIDDRVYAKLAALHLSSSGRASDIEFIRRIYIDLTGSLPSPDVVKSFVKDRDSRRREKLVDDLMSRPEFVDFWTYKWCDLLRVNRGTLKDKGMWAFYDYIHDAVRTDKPWNVLAREVLTSTGNTFLDGPANYFRTALKPEELAENVSQGFMGIRVQCAKCHNHPLEKWTQNEYYGMANLFARVKFKADLAIYANDEMTVYNTPEGDVIQPRLGRPVPPKPLGGPVLAANSNLDRRAFLADWLTQPDNWYFPRAIVNRVWAHFMGRGLIEPVDDLRDTNPATNPALMDALASDFTKHNYDLRHLMRVIVLSEAYQRSSAPNQENSQDNKYFSHYLVRRLSAEEILDTLDQVTGIPEQFPGLPPGYRALQLPDTHVKSEFMDTFGRPARQITCECERSQEPSMAQALTFINSDLINRKVTSDGGLADKLVKSGRNDGDILDELYWTALGRPPRASERIADLEALKKAEIAPVPTGPMTWLASLVPQDKTSLRRKAFEDLLWVLVNSKEFLFNH
jgi:hypothetical protein